MATYLIVTAILLTVNNCAFAVLPDYIHVCHRNDPEVTKCILQSVEALRPRLLEGIPEINVPSIEPIVLPEVVVARGGDSANFKAICRNVKIYGAGNFQVTKLKLDIPNYTYFVSVKFPKLRFQADIDVNAKILLVPIKGEGKLDANATDCFGNAILKGKLVTENGITREHFDTLDLDLTIDDIEVHLEDIFGGDEVIGQAINQALYESRDQIFARIKPLTEETASEVILDMINKIVANLEYDEVFPE